MVESSIYSEKHVQRSEHLFEALLVFHAWSQYQILNVDSSLYIFPWGLTTTGYERGIKSVEICRTEINTWAGDSQNKLITSEDVKYINLLILFQIQEKTANHYGKTKLRENTICKVFNKKTLTNIDFSSWVMHKAYI